jgi:hypothetical protein
VLTTREIKQLALVFRGRGLSLAACVAWRAAMPPPAGRPQQARDCLANTVALYYVAWRESSCLQTAERGDALS